MPDPLSRVSDGSTNACYEPELPVPDLAATSTAGVTAPHGPTNDPSLSCATESASTSTNLPAVTQLVNRFTPWNGSRVSSSYSNAGGEGNAARGLPAHGVLMCHRVADLPLNQYLKLEHHFLVTSTRAAGAGHCGEGVPGHGAVDLPLSPMCIIDHTQEVEAPGVSCHPVDADEACVDRALELGQSLGPWAPPFNDCQTFVARVLAGCAVYPLGDSEGASGIESKGATGGH